MRAGILLAALLLAVSPKAHALDLSDDLTVSGYGDLRVVAPSSPAPYLDGGLGKFRFGDGAVRTRFTEAVAQIDWRITGDLGAVGVVRAEPYTPSVVDAEEVYLRYAPKLSDDFGLQVKAGAFFPTISLENDDLGWASPYTLTSSAINSWIGDELRTLGSEATLRWNTSDFGTVSLIGAVTCCNDEAGILMADRGWTFNDRPIGLFERVRLPAQTLISQRAASSYGRTGMFDEIDGRVGWYAGATWQMPVWGKLSVLRYDNEGDPMDRSSRDAAWDTRFWSVGYRNSFGPLTILAQALRGDTVIAGPTFVSHTKFQSLYGLASYDWESWRFSIREDLFATRRANATNNTWSEDGDAFTAAVSYAPRDWLRLTGELIAMDSRRGEYVPAGLGLNRTDTQFQFSTRFFF